MVLSVVGMNLLANKSINTGVDWLAQNTWKCTVAPPGGGPGGGSRHAH